MTYPWAAGEVLTAADLNAYAGLVLVKTETVGTTVASVTVSDAFSSTFDNYKIVLSNVDASAGSIGVEMQLGSTAANYYFTGYFLTLAAGPTRFVGNNVSQWTIGVTATNNDTSLVCDVSSPNLAARTTYMAKATGGAVTYDTAGMLADTTQYTAFTIKVASPYTLTGGKIRVYGYNNG